MTGPSLDRLRRAGRRSALIGVGGWILLIVLMIEAPASFGPGYLAGFVLWTGLPLGVGAVLMMHHLVGGRWGDGVRPIMIAAVMTIPLLALMFVPVLFELHALYPWADPARVAASDVLKRQSPYLNTPGFVIRAIVFFGLWVVGGLLLVRRSRGAGSPRAPALAASGVLIYGLTVSFAGIDWLASLQAKWYSSIFGMYIIVGQALTGLAILAVATVWFSGADKNDESHVRVVDDLGRLILTAVALHAYVAYSQFFIIWNGDQPDTTSWYAPRMRGAWGVVAVIIIGAHFVIPLLALLSHAVRRTRRAVAAVALLVLAARGLDAAWFVLPSTAGPVGLSAVSYLASLAAVGGLLVAVMMWGWKRNLMAAAAVAGAGGRPDE